MRILFDVESVYMDWIDWIDLDCSRKLSIVVKILYSP